MKMGVHIKKLRRDFNKFKAVDNIDFSFYPGQVHGFIGPNGAGKTTTMRILATLDIPTAGDAIIMGKSIIDDPQMVRKRIGFVPDWFSGFNSTTVHEYLDFFARAHDLRGKERVITVGEIEEFTNLTPLRDKLITELSRGMQQRVTLGRALVNNPDVLLMDEPAANLDPRARIELRELVKALAERQKAILISSHILPELAEMCDSVTIIDKGKILKSGSIRDIKKTIKPHKTVSIRILDQNSEETEKALLESPGVKNVRESGENYQFDIEGDDQAVAELLKYFIEKNLPVIDFHILEEGLEDIFMAITGAQEASENQKK
jgi:ABC-2 type transport system ATP-binding protein